MKILITGGAGYIGSFMVKNAIDMGYEVTVVDSLEGGSENVIDKRSRFIKGNLKDKGFVNNLFSDNEYSAVVHFAGYISMAESMSNPYLYFENNVGSSLNILESMVKHKTNNFIFSSTAGVYGNPIKLPIIEEDPKAPTNPYGESKLMVEKILGWYQKIYNLNFVSLRYFNACGGSLDGSMGENHSPETHLIPNAMSSITNNTELVLYGDDYDTKDGTCVRDYIHVLDLVDAHILAINKLTKDKGGFFYNVGTGKGHSNKEVLASIEKVSGSKINLKTTKRRAGDAAVLIADPTKIKNELGFSPRHSDLDAITKTAWGWHRKLKIKNEK